MPPVGFETTISEGERPHTNSLDRAATGTGKQWHYNTKISETRQKIWHSTHQPLSI